jgi:hypothetical protein
MFRLLSICSLLWGCAALPAQDLHLSLASRTAQSCGGAFAAVNLQQDLEDVLKAASIGVSRVHTATLSNEIDCKAAAAPALAVTQCLSLAQAVPDASAANGLHLATTWRNCQSYNCSGARCGRIAISTERMLADRFIAEFPQKSAPVAAAVPIVPVVPAALELPPANAALLPAAYVHADKPALNPVIVFWSAYILVCIAVLACWGRTRQPARTRF